ncbi:tetratricopeptide repeat-containing sensor histidine kinase [Psychroserpens mesophilus]|uniref:tetratricopeptide repeat-containing sensor histidine kinase n=1 Tax=Psychroserpens mesophilus TaxID=325473 RepID=UPI00058C35F2|nr:histidine kinase dimerization/phosphoacceptor domain -containing protein [Psychroserpens mesophilus]
MRFTFIVTVLFFVLTPISSAQNVSKIDSLQIVIEHTKNDSIKMDAYNKLRRLTYYSDPNSSKDYTQKFYEYAKKRKDSFSVALANYYLGNAHVVESDFETAIQFYFKSADYFEKKKDSARLSSVFNGIGAAYENSGNDTLSLKYFKRSQNISKSIGDLRRSAIALNNIGNIYKNRGDLENAKYYMERALEDVNNTNHIEYITSLSINLANTYLDLNEIDNATPLFEKVIMITDSISDIYSYASALRGLGNVAIAEGNNKKGLKLLNDAYHKYKTNRFFDEQLSIMPDLILANELNKNYAQGLHLANHYQKLKDSIFNEQKDKNLSEALQKYETEKKDAQLKLLKVETEKREQQNQLYITLAIAGLFMAGVLGYFSFKNRQKNKILAKQKSLLEDTLDEKNTLLKEVHHRVKNSFQIVSSLLYLQSENVEDKEAKIAIKEAENRVRSMVLIHQRLYNKDELIGINAKDYFSDLVRDIFESHQFESNPISYHLDVEPFVLDIETITPVGLILNELIVNTLKHAFDEVTSESKIDILFQKQEEHLVLRVIDNGKGFEGEVKSASFGITLIKALSKKLKATLNYKSKIDYGTDVTLIIKRYNLL